MVIGVFLTGCPAAPSRAAVPPEAKVAAPDAAQASPTLEELLDQISAAYRHKNYDLGLSLVKKAFELKQNDVSSVDRIGSIYYAMGRYGEALSIWTRALPLEHDVRKRRALENSILVTRRGLGLEDEPAVAAVSTAPAAAQPAAPGKKALSAEAKASVQALYKKGVKYYASGQYLQATTAFFHILELDPGNEDATKALKRLNLGR